MIVTQTPGSAAPPPRSRAIPTTYRKTRFRSRLEARWAAFFDLIGWSWVYEPLDAEGWIPDFLIEGDAPFLVEVGPCIIPREYIEKAEDGAVGYRDHPTLIAGATPLAGEMSIADDWVAGVLINEFPAVQPFSDGPAFWMTDPQGRILIYSDGVDPDTSYPHRVPWDDGLDHVSRSVLVQLRDLWADAGNQVQWRRRG